LSNFLTRASSINRALDQVGDKWCLLILQEVFWGIHSFNELMAVTGASRGVLSDRLKWLQSVDCLTRERQPGPGRQVRYHLTRKSMDLYQCALMALQWERDYFDNPGLDQVTLHHLACDSDFNARLHCAACGGEVSARDVTYAPGPGATRDERDKKVRRRSSIPVSRVPGSRRQYLNLINVVGDRWSANLIALSFHGLTRFDQFHRELPVATNILADRLKLLVEHGIFRRVPYRESPRRYDYCLTMRGEDLFSWFLTLMQWGDQWCDPTGNGPPMLLTHTVCGRTLRAQVSCNVCGDELRAREVVFSN
jgi:DNA-binding HxlR family transcriptional regulator